MNEEAGRLAQALEAVYKERYGQVAARYIVECIAEGKDWSDVLPRLDVAPDGDPRTVFPSVEVNWDADAIASMVMPGPPRVIFDGDEI